MIQIQNVSKWYGLVQVTNDCSMSIAKGDVVVVCGPSGSGKSTLIKTVNALELFQKGEITVDGIPLQDPRTNLPALRSKVGMAFQHFELFPHLSVTENLTVAQIKVLGRRPDGSNARELKMLDRVGLMVHKKQVSRPVVRRPAAARGDRPCTVDGPDRHALRRTYLGARPGDGRELLDVTVNLAKEGMTMMVVTHEMAFARKVASRVIFIDVGGRILEDCLSDDFLSHPENRQPRIKDFLDKLLHH